MASRINYIGKGAIVFMFVILCSCTKYNYIDGGVANGVHDCSMWDYFQKDGYDWDSTMIMIEHAGLKSLFDGTGEHKQITFFGLTNLSIRRYILNNNADLDEDDPRYLHRVTDISVAKCKDILEKLVLPGKRILLNDVPRGRRLQSGSAYVETDGMKQACVKGEIFLWTVRKAYNNIEDTGEVELYLSSRNVVGARNEQVASTDIRTTNGVVQALSYDFRFENF